MPQTQAAAMAITPIDCARARNARDQRETEIRCTVRSALALPAGSAAWVDTEIRRYNVDREHPPLDTPAAWAALYDLDEMWHALRATEIAAERRLADQLTTAPAAELAACACGCCVFGRGR